MRCRASKYGAGMQETPKGNPPWNFGVLPVEYLLDLYDLLRQFPIDFMTGNDLVFEEGSPATPEALNARLQSEYYGWYRAARAAHKPSAILIFHDTDSGPEQTLDLCAREAERGLRSTVSILSHRMEKGALREYDINYGALCNLQQSGFCFTYHCNAWEMAGYDEAALPAVFENGVAWLEGKGLSIRHFSPHGGKPSPDGRNNNSFFYPAYTQRDLIWTHNRHGINGRQYSDGSLMNRLRKGDATLDLQAFLIENITLARRIILLFHAQYYYTPNRKLVEEMTPLNPWLARYWKLYDKGNAKAYWKPLRRALLAYERSHAQAHPRKRVSRRFSARCYRLLTRLMPWR